jgi:hypothetical protein
MARKTKSSKKKWRCSLRSKGLCTAAEIGRVVTTFGSIITILGLIVMLVIDMGVGVAEPSGGVAKAAGLGAGIILALIAFQCLVWWLVYKFDALAAGIVVVWGVALVLAVIGMLTKK